MNKLLIIIALFIIEIPVAMTIQSAADNQVNRCEVLYDLFEDDMNVCVAASKDASMRTDQPKSAVEEIRVIKSQSDQFIVDEAYLLREALTKNQVDIDTVEYVFLENEKSLSCSLRDSIPGKVELDIKLPTYMGERTPLTFVVPNVTLRVNLELKTRLSC